MWVELQFLRAEFDSPERQLLGLSDMEVVSISGRTYLLIAGAADAGLSSYEVMPDGSLVASDDVLASAGSGTSGVSDITTYAVGGMTYVLGAGMSDNNQVVYELGASGTFGVSASYIGLGTFDKWQLTTVVESGGNSYLFGSIWGMSGLFQFDIQTGGGLANPILHTNTPEVFLGDVQAIESAVLHGTTFMFVASGLEAGLQSYLIAPDGTPVWLDTVPPEDYGFGAITALAPIDVGDRAFLIVASAGTDSLMVLRVSSGGQMNLVERLVDTNATRFEQVSALEVFEADGRFFLVAGGSDDGITLFEITYKGQLDELVTVADTAETTLQNITDIEVVVLNGIVNIFVSSATDHGFTQFSVVLPGVSGLITGGAVPDTLHGTAGNDTIYGYGRSDILYGHQGDDRLVDGRGTDQLWGGDGADIFEFIADGRTDFIMDFEAGVDLIDLRAAEMLYHYSEITFLTRDFGARLEYGGEILLIYTMDGTPLTADMFGQDDFIFG